MEKETRYSRLSDYNRTRIINKIKELIIADGGKILTHNMKEYNLKAYTDFTDKRKETIDKLPEITKFDYSSACGDNLKFILNSYYYSIDYDDNPFFAITYNKIKINDNGEYIGKRYLYSSDDINEKSWKKDKEIAFSIGYDNLFKVCNDEEINSMALDHYESIKKYVINGKESEIYSEKIRVNNYYDNGYHYETKYDDTLCKIEL